MKYKATKLHTDNLKIIDNVTEEDRKITVSRSRRFIAHNFK